MTSLQWISMLWQAMSKTGRGFRQPIQTRRPPKGASHWRGERRPDKVEQARREAESPIFTGKLNFRRSERPY